MNCSHMQELLSAYVDGELFGSELAQVAAHIEACSSCQFELTQQSLLKERLALLPVVAVPPLLKKGVMARLETLDLTQAIEAQEPPLTASKQAKRGGFGTKRRFFWQAGMAAAVVAALTFAWSLRLGPEPLQVADGPRPGAGSPQESAPQGTATGDKQQPEESNVSPSSNGADSNDRANPRQPDNSESSPPDNGTPLDPDGPDLAVAKPEPNNADSEVSTPVASNTDDTPEIPNRFSTTASGPHVADERLVADTLRLSLVAADPASYEDDLVAIAAEVGGSVQLDSDGDLSLLVPRVDGMSAINRVAGLAAKDTFKIVSAPKIDLTEAVRNLQAQQDFLRKDAGNDPVVDEELRAIDIALARHYRQLEHLTLYIKVEGLSR